MSLLETASKKQPTTVSAFLNCLLQLYITQSQRNICCLGISSIILYYSLQFCFYLFTSSIKKSRKSIYGTRDREGKGKSPALPEKKNGFLSASLAASKAMKESPSRIAN